jgi:hypothetical protein
VKRAGPFDFSIANIYCLNIGKCTKTIEYSLRESVSTQGREGRGFDSDPWRKKRAIFYLVIRKSR